MTPPADRRIQRELSAAIRSGWHMVDLVTAIPNPGDSTVTRLFGEVVVIVRSREDGDLYAYRCQRKPRGEPQLVECAVRYEMIFVRLRPAQRPQEASDARELAGLPGALDRAGR
ncbi:(2Fe-2S)-binding protein [Streptomyces sp. NPDC058045]|uniref:(2Fe-2S)-binding protein n=1 Tax=Streptomyces sp. NPDC058045 TaxID=3346311 RepID=UPI0036EE9B55